MKEIRILKKEKKRLYIQLIIASLLFCIVASWLFLHFHNVLRQEELERSYIELQEFSQQSSKKVKAILDNSLKHIENITEIITLTEERDIIEIEKKLKKEMVSVQFNYIGIADVKGLAQTTANEKMTIDVSEEEFFKKAIIGISNTSNLITQPLQSEYESVNAVPIYKNGVIIGVLYGAIDVESFSEAMTNMNENRQYYFGIVEQDGNFILKPKKENSILEENFWEDISQTNLLENDIDQIKINMVQNEDKITPYILSGEQRYMHYTPYGENKWYTISVMNPEIMDKKLHKINTMVWKLLVEVLGIFVLTFAWIFYLSKKSRDEMMQMNQILKQNETSLAIAVSQGTQVIFDYDIETKQLTFRYKGNEKYGFSRQLENIPESLIQQNWVVSSSVEDVRTVFEKIEEGQQTASAIIKIKQPNGNFVWSKIIVTNIFDREKSSIIQTVGILEDATLLKESEMKI